MKVKKLQELNVENQRLLIRQDLNVPLDGENVVSDKRIVAAVPTIIHAMEHGARVLLMSHLGRPVEGQPEARYSLAPVANHLGSLLGKPVRLIDNYLQQAPEVAPGEVVMLENVRFNPGEKANDDSLAKQYAALCDIYVMDAFGTAHRAQASTYGAGVFANTACAGPLLSAELDALEIALDNPARPLLAIVGGSKVSTKLTVLETLAGKVDQLIVGGGIANTFIAAMGHEVGNSLYEQDLLDEAVRLMTDARANQSDIPVPGDVVCGTEFSESSAATLKATNAVSKEDMIFDIGPETIAAYTELINKAGTILWNGPVGVFEFDQFAKGTEALARAIAESSAFSIAGGGDTLAAVDKYGIENQVSYISTGGGAFLEFLEGKKLPAVQMLELRAE